MTKNQKLDEATKEAIRADVRNIKNSGETKKQIAERFNIHPTMISKIMQGATVEAKPAKVAKRKTVKKTTQSKNGTSGAKYTEADFEAALNNYFIRRAEFRTANELLKKIAKELK